MADEELRIAVAGAGNLGGKCLEALAEVDGVTVVGVGDPDGSRSAAAAAAFGAEAFSDHRQLLQQLKPDVLIVTAPTAAGADLVRLAAQTGAAVIKAPPLGRTLDEAAELVEVMAAAGLPFAVLAPRRFFGSYRGLLDGLDRLGKLFLARAAYVLNWDRNLGWRADQASAGGGVLLDAGYQMIDLWIGAMGLPEEVYAVTGRGGRPHMVETDGEMEPRGIYDTDDTAVVALRTAAGAAGTIVTSWVTSPATEHLMLHGQNGSGVAEADHCTFHDADGLVIERIEGDDRPTPALVDQLSQLAAAFAAGAATYASSALEHMLTMATVEAAYLSDRTGQPENPRQLLKPRGLTPEACLKLRPTAVE